MAQIDRNLVGVGLAWLVLGMLLGFYIGAANDNQLLQVHVAMLLGGFVVITTYGVLYRLWPAMKEGGLAKLQFWIAVISSVGITAGTVQRAFDGSVTLAAISSVLAIAGAVLMGWLFMTRSAAGIQPFASDIPATQVDSTRSSVGSSATISAR
jgi:hypothetical protein